MMISFSDAKTLILMGQSLLKGAAKEKNLERRKRIISTLKIIYFEDSTISLIRQTRSKTRVESDEAARLLQLKLLDGRYQVDRSLTILRDEGVDFSLTLKQRRLFDLICFGKVHVRQELFRIIDGADADVFEATLASIEKLNSEIEELEEKFHEGLELR